MKLLQRVQCVVVGSHARDRKRAHFDGEQFRSVCSGCGKPMVKMPSGWTIEVATTVHPVNGNRENADPD